MVLTQQLSAAYARTTYSVELPSGAVGIRINDLTPLLDEWLRSIGCNCWAYLTAFNPQSRLLSRKENERRNAALEKELLTLGLTVARGRGVADDGQWPPEESFCVAELCEMQAVTLARRFEQLAIVVGRVGGLATLVAVDDSVAGASATLTTIAPRL